MSVPRAGLGSAVPGRPRARGPSVCGSVLGLSCLARVHGRSEKWPAGVPRRALAGSRGPLLHLGCSDGATPLGKAQRGKDGRDRLFLPTSWLQERSLWVPLARKPARHLLCAGLGLGHHPRGKRTLHTRRHPTGATWPCVGSPPRGRLWGLDVSVVVSGWSRSWGNLTPSSREVASWLLAFMIVLLFLPTAFKVILELFCSTP